MASRSRDREPLVVHPDPESEASQDSAGRILAVLAGLDLPAQAVDGDCIPLSGAVRAALNGRGIGAEIASVYGWAAPDVLAFLHQAVTAGELVIDVTATQFDTRLPAVIVAPAEEYVAMLSEATGVSVTLG